MFLVLPLPAPAKINSGPSVVTTAFFVHRLNFLVNSLALHSIVPAVHKNNCCVYLLRLVKTTSNT